MEPASSAAFPSFVGTARIIPNGEKTESRQELAIKLGVKHSTTTIRRYMVRRREPRGGQTGRTFVKNHASQIYALDFLTQHTALFTTVYVFVVLEIATRRIVLINATTSPGLQWMKQQIRHATGWAQTPRCLSETRTGLSSWRWRTAGMRIGPITERAQPES